MSEQPTGRQRDREVVLTDPRAIRALAHPARSLIIDDLYQGNVRTASELAELVGLTPSATSYHLRALEKWGILERAEPTGDGRERPWRACGRGLRWEGAGGPGPAGQALYDSIAGTYLDRLRHHLADWAAAQDTEDPVWRETGMINRGYPWLTAEEATELGEELAAVVRRFVKDRDALHHPEGTRRFAYLQALVPVTED